MKLLRLTVRNFKGAKDFTLLPAGADITIKGDNRAGKTTIADAHYWLLFGKDSLGSAKFEIKTLKDGKPMTGLEHSVEGEFEVAGKTLTLRKVFKEVWTTKRRGSDKEFTGHTTDHFINSEPVQEKQYLARVEAICPEQTLRLLSGKEYFSGINWQDRRRILVDAFGDISDADVIESDKKLAPLPEILGDHTTDAYKKIAAAKRKEASAEKESLPTRIDEASRSEPVPADLPTGTKAEAEAELSALQAKRATAEAGGLAAEKTKRLREIEAEILDIENRARSAASAVGADAQVAIRAKDKEIADVEAAIALLDGRIASTKLEADRLRPGRERLIAEFKAESAKGFTGNSECPACGQGLPEDQVAAAIEEFNQAKARKLEANRAEGKALMERIGKLDQDVAAWESQVATLADGLPALKEERAALPNPEQPALVDSPEHAAKAAEKVALEAEIAALKLDGAGELGLIAESIAAAKDRIAQFDQAEAQASQKKNAEKRIAELKAREKELAIIIEKLDRELFLIEQFIRAKVRMLTEKINSQFEIARFKLFNELVNGGIEECCEIMVDGVPYGSLNHGSRINAGLDIIRALQAHHGFHPVIFVDGCESVTRLLPMECQVIRLVVSEAHKELHIDTGGVAAPSNGSAPKADQEALITA